MAFEEVIKEDGGRSALVGVVSISRNRAGKTVFLLAGDVSARAGFAHKTRVQVFLDRTALRGRIMKAEGLAGFSLQHSALASPDVFRIAIKGRPGWGEGYHAAERFPVDVTPGAVEFDLPDWFYS